MAPTPFGTRYGAGADKLEKTVRFALLSVFMLTVCSGQTARVGFDVGEKAPSFSLPDQNGTVRTLDSLKGAKGLILVFFRSADW